MFVQEIAVRISWQLQTLTALNFLLDALHRIVTVNCANFKPLIVLWFEAKKISPEI